VCPLGRPSEKKGWAGCDRSEAELARNQQGLCGQHQVMAPAGADCRWKPSTRMCKGRGGGVCPISLAKNNLREERAYSAYTSRT
jgi:hypothetical protein